MKDKEIAAIIGNKKIEGLSLSSYVDKHDWEKGSVLLVPEDELFSVFKKGSCIELHQMQGKELIKFYATVADVDMPGRHVTVVDLEKIGDKEAGKKEDPAKEKKEGDLIDKFVQFRIAINFLAFNVKMVDVFNNLNNNVSYWTSNQLLWKETLREISIGEFVEFSNNFISGHREVFRLRIKDIDLERGVLALENYNGEERGAAEEKKEAVNHPSHYQLGDLGIEALDVMKATMTKEQMEGFYIGNVQKYTLRAAQKNGLEDFKKALFYLKKLVELMEV